MSKFRRSMVNSVYWTVSCTDRAGTAASAAVHRQTQFAQACHLVAQGAFGDSQPPGGVLAAAIPLPQCRDNGTALALARGAVEAAALRRHVNLVAALGHRGARRGNRNWGRAGPHSRGEG